MENTSRISDFPQCFCVHAPKIIMFLVASNKACIITRSILQWNLIMALYGCVRWGLPRSLGSYISSPFSDSGIEIESFIIKATSSGLCLILTQDDMYYVGNPVSREWVKIRPYTLSDLKSYILCEKFGLATRVDENGVVLGYKVVLVITSFKEAIYLALQIYSSETGEWTCKNVRCPSPIPWPSLASHEPISLNEMLHWVENGEYYNDAGGIVAIDLYNTSPVGEDQCWVIPFPNENLRFNTNNNNRIWSRRTCTTSGESIMYINMISESTMKVWRMKKNFYAIESREYWQLSWEIDLAYVDYCVGSIPMVMHPFDKNVLYLWSMEKSCLVSINLRKQNSTLYTKSENYSDGCIINSMEKCKIHMDVTYKNPYLESSNRGLFFAQQFFPSVWIDPVPRPPFPPCVYCGR